MVNKELILKAYMALVYCKVSPLVILIGHVVFYWNRYGAICYDRIFIYIITYVMNYNFMLVRSSYITVCRKVKGMIIVGTPLSPYEECSEYTSRILPF